MGFLKKLFGSHSDHELKKIYHDIMLERLREKEKNEEVIAGKGKTDYLDIMGDVLDDQVSTVVGRMGLFRSISMKRKLSAQRKEQAELGFSKA